MSVVNQRTSTKECRPSTYKSLISLFLIIGSLFTLAFLQMEERRRGYEVLKLNRELKVLLEKKKLLEIKRLKALKPQKIENEIQARNDFNQADFRQIIHLSPAVEDISKTKVSKNRISTSAEGLQL